MRSLELRLEDDAMDELEAVSARRKRDAAGLASDLVRQFLDKERTRQSLSSPQLLALYSELSEEDVALAEAGIEDYLPHLESADRETPA